MSTKQENNKKNVYILITQCLQNGFFLDTSSRLCLPDIEVARMLIGSQDQIDPVLILKKEKGVWGDLFGDFTFPSKEKNPNRREIPEKVLKNGPLYRFFEELNEACAKRDDELHMIHIKDWHESTVSYDEERKRYGVHAEANSWASASLEGFEKFLNPWGRKSGGHREARTEDGYKVPDKSIVCYEVRSDSVYDFKPSVGADDVTFTPNTKAQLSIILDKLITGSPNENVYCIVLGVYTDIKVKTLLTGLRSRYPIQNLIVSDVLTASPNLERHLAGLDFFDKVLAVEVIHSLNDLIRVIKPLQASDGKKGDKNVLPSIDDSLFETSIDFREYKNFFLDKQNLLAYQDRKQIEYLELTHRRANRIYRQIKRANSGLIIFGFLFLALTFGLSLANFITGSNDNWGLIAVTGGVSLSQLIVVFFGRPMQQLQENLNNIIRLRTSIESHSMLTALARHHLSRPERLYAQKEPGLEKQELENFQFQVGLVQQIAKTSSELFSEIRLSNWEALDESSEEAAVPGNENGEADPKQLNE